ncbi:tRNA 2-selenouridine synthase [Campylobacter concisus]|uniref:tRNA 2-selenouridine synthase n=1 Tax=Campylobacter concisus TaxID=199 RepID=UPI001883E88E|nr:tRNA 2-selenouridine synthase [Campylobacter concisus]MBE9836460.1 tRNA 2-selenouridine synthase [Campylobacter concisus]
MKFIGIILLLLTSIFLIACSANQASNKISNSELENLASKYGGVYVFNEKFEKEIEKREAERKELSKTLGDKIRSNPRKIKQGDKFITIYDVDTTLINKQLPQILSNGKKYYTRWIDYERETGKKAEIPEVYINKIKEFMGDENYNKSPNLPILVMFYVDNNDEITPIKLSMSYTYYRTKYGLFGDEGHGVRFKDEEQIFIRGGNKFILINGKFERVSKDK